MAKGLTPHWDLLRGTLSALRIPWMPALHTRMNGSLREKVLKNSFLILSLRERDEHCVAVNIHNKDQKRPHVVSAA